MNMPIDSKFNLDDYSLPNLFCEVSVYLDKGELSEEELKKVTYVSDILREKSRDFRTGNETNTDAFFFWDFYGKKKEESDRYSVREIYADRLLKLSEELAIVKNLPKEKSKDLGIICAKISQSTLKYWNSQHPNGFKKY
jgi:hypothetical protein